MNLLLNSAFLLRLAFTIFISCLIAYFLCDIQSGIEYTWYSGIWHGLFVIPNLILSLFFDGIHMKAEISTSAYTFFWWVILITQNSYLVRFFMALFS